MSAYTDAVQRTVVICIAVIGTLGNSAFDAFVCFAVSHCKLLLPSKSEFILPTFQKNNLIFKI